MTNGKKTLFTDLERVETDDKLLAADAFHQIGKRHAAVQLFEEQNEYIIFRYQRENVLQQTGNARTDDDGGSGRRQRRRRRVAGFVANCGDRM